MLFAWIGIAAGAGLLYVGAEGLLRGSASLAVRLGLTPLVIGLTVVAMGTSMPEMVVSVDAALDGRGGLAVGNVIGSNLFNILGILGVTALIRSLDAGGLARTDLWLMVGFTAPLGVFMFTGTRVRRGEGAILLVGYVAYIGFLLLR